MSSVKKNFAKAIGYIKRDMYLLQDEKNEIEEFLGYYADDGIDTRIKRLRVAKESTRLTKIDKGLKKLQEELSFYKEYFRYSQNEIDAIPMATEESIQKDYEMIQQELKDNTWTEEDTKRVLAKAGITQPTFFPHARQTRISQ